MDGEAIHAAAQALLARRSAMSAADYHQAAMRQAQTIHEFLQGYGEAVDMVNPGLITELGKDFDSLASGVSATLDAAQKSPVWEGVKEGAKAFAEEVEKKTKTGLNWLPWILGGGIALGLAIAFGRRK